MLGQLKSLLNTSGFKILVALAIVASTAYAAQNFNSINVNGNITVTGNVDGRDVSADGSVIDAITANGVTALTSGEVDQLENINSTTISSSTWGFLGGIDQALSTTSSPSFNSITGTISTASQPNITAVGTLTALSVNSFLDLLQQTTPANPSSNRNRLYFKSDDKLYKLTSAGVETEVGSGGGSFDDSTFSIYDNGDATKVINFQASPISTGTTRTITMANANVDLADVANATSSNTVDTVVKRDGSGNFSAGSITASLSGNASTATSLQTARNINGTSFNGTADITVTAAAGTLTGTTLNASVVSSSLTSVGTIGTGVWQGTAVGSQYGGTGQNFSASTGLVKVASGTMSAAALVNADVDASAAIAYSKLAALTASRVLVSDGSGFVSVSSVTTASLPRTFDANITYSSGTPTVTNEYGGDWISSITDNGTGQPTLNISGFTTAPSCQCTTKEQAVSGSACMITSTTTSAVNIRTRDLASTLQDEHFYVTCKEYF